jgi:hypothetical protein
MTALTLTERTVGEPCTALVAPVACRCGHTLTYENGTHGGRSLARAVLFCTKCHNRYLVTVEMCVIDPPKGRPITHKETVGFPSGNPPHMCAEVTAKRKGPGDASTSRGQADTPSSEATT